MVNITDPSTISLGVLYDCLEQNEYSPTAGPLILIGQCDIQLSSRYKPGFSRRCSHRASSIDGIILGHRPTRFNGAPGVPNMSRFERIYLTACLLHPAAAAVLDIDIPFFVISQISCFFVGGKEGAIFDSKAAVSRR